MATFIDKRPSRKKPPKLTAEEKRHEEIKAARKNAIKVASQALTVELERRADLCPNGYRVGSPHSARLTCDDFPTAEDFNK